MEIIANPVNNLARSANEPERESFARSLDDSIDSSEFEDIVTDTAKRLEEGKGRDQGSGVREQGAGGREQDEKDDDEDSVLSSNQIGLIALNVSNISLTEDIKMEEEVTPGLDDNNKTAQSLTTKEELSDLSNELSIINEIAAVEETGDLEDHKAVSLIKMPDKGGEKEDISEIITENGGDDSGLIKPFLNTRDTSHLYEHYQQESSLTSHNEEERHLETSQAANMVNNDKIMHQEKIETGNNTISKSEIFDQILEKTANFVKKGTNSITISLKPEHLGKLQIEISEKDSLIKATIITENIIIKEIIESNQSSLKNALAQNGLAIDYFSVLVDQHGKEPDNGKRDRFLNKIGQQFRDKYEKEHISNEIRINLNNAVNIFI